MANTKYPFISKVELSDKRLPLSIGNVVSVNGVKTNIEFFYVSPIDNNIYAGFTNVELPDMNVTDKGLILLTNYNPNFKQTRFYK